MAAATAHREMPTRRTKVFLRFAVVTKTPAPYIAGLPTALCGAQPSQVITLVKHNATAAEAAPVPRACIDRRSWRRPEAQNMQEQLQLHSAIRS